MGASGLAAILAVAGLLPTAGQREAGAQLARPATETAGAALTVSPEQGPAPLTVNFTATAGGASYFGGVWIDFADGGRALLCPPGLSCRDATIRRTYERPGTYAATLIGLGEGDAETLGTAVVRIVGEDTRL